MSVVLRVIIDDVGGDRSDRVDRYPEELTRALIATAPPGCEVAGVVSASRENDHAAIRDLLPGLSDLLTTNLARRELQLAWQHGITKLPGTGMVHAPSPLAPLARHDRSKDASEQVVVTFNDTSAWTHPELLDPREVSWTRAMGRRAHRHADAVVVPTHAAAEELDALVGFGGRIRVVGGAVTAKLTVPVDADRRASELALPERYVLSAGVIDRKSGLEALIGSMAIAGADFPDLMIAGPVGWGGLDVEAIARREGVDGRVRHLGVLSDADLAVALDRATVFASPRIAGGSAIGVLEAFHAGTPVVHSDLPAMVEVSADSGKIVEAADADLYPDRLASAVAEVAGDDALRTRLRYLGRDRAAAFTWRDTAMRIWQVHADL